MSHRLRETKRLISSLSSLVAERFHSRSPRRKQHRARLARNTPTQLTASTSPPFQCTPTATRHRFFALVHSYRLNLLAFTAAATFSSPLSRRYSRPYARPQPSPRSTPLAGSGHLPWRPRDSCPDDRKNKTRFVRSCRGAEREGERARAHTRSGGRRRRPGSEDAKLAIISLRTKFPKLTQRRRKHGLCFRHKIV